MTHPLTPREKVLLAICKNKGRTSGDLADAILTALASGSGDHSGGVTDMIDHAELARLADMSACVIARHGRAPSLDDLPSDPENWSGFAHAKILAEHRATLLAENAALRAERDRNWDEFIAERQSRMEHGAREAGYLSQVAALNDRATEAERKLAEAAGLRHLTDSQLFAAINAAVTITRDRNGVDNGSVCISPEKFRTFLSKEAERG